MTTSHKTKWREWLIKQPEDTKLLQERYPNATLIVCEKCRTILPVEMIRYSYCPNCGRKISSKPTIGFIA